jgi:hypothetical protein
MHALATREALDRFLQAVPSGLSHEPVLRAAASVRALFATLVDSRGERPLMAPFADHDLAVLIADAAPLAAAAGTSRDLADALAELCFSVRRRLVAALEADPDDLALALALAAGLTLVARRPQLRFELRVAEDIGAVAAALMRPHAGPRLAQAAVAALLAVRGVKDEAIAKAALPLIAPVRSALERVSARLPDHPDLALDRVRLVLHDAARHETPSEALPALSTARGLLDDFTRRFGLARAQRDLLAELVQVRARLGVGGPDLRTEVRALLTLEVAERLATPERTRTLLKALHRAGGLDAELSRELTRLLGLDARGRGEADARWDEVRALLLDAVGDEKALLELAERTLLADPKHAASARRLFDRWVTNVRDGLAPPFASTVAERVLDAAPAACWVRLSQEELARFLEAITAVFGSERAFRAVTGRVLEVRECRGRDGVWALALGLAEPLGDAAVVALAGLVRGDKVPPEVRVAGARAVLDRGEDPELADSLLRGLQGARGAVARDVAALLGRLRGDPRLRESHRRALVAFEEKVGVGSGKRLGLRVIYTSPSYALAELVGAQAPEVYEHRHLRAMLRDDDLPAGVHARDLRKGDLVEAPLRGQDATRDEQKGALRIYWVADRNQVRVVPAVVSAPEAAPEGAGGPGGTRSGAATGPRAKGRAAGRAGAPAVSSQEAGEGSLEGAEVSADPAAPDAPAPVDPRLVEADFGIGGEAPIEIRVLWDSRRKRLTGRRFDAEGNRFPANLRVSGTSLPEGLEPARLGRHGKRFLARVEGHDEGESRHYVVVGPLTLVARPAEDAPAASGDDEKRGEAASDAYADAPAIEVEVA